MVRVPLVQGEKVLAYFTLLRHRACGESVVKFIAPADGERVHRVKRAQAV